MKIIKFVVVSLLTLVVLISSCQAQQNERWILLKEDQTYKISLDSETFESNFGKNADFYRANLWIEVEETKNKTVYRNHILTEINLNSQKMRMKTLQSFNIVNGKARVMPNKSTEWEDLVPDSYGELICMAIFSYDYKKNE